MRGLLSNPFQRPSGRPSLNRKHPATAQNAIRMAAVAGMSGGMTDLVSGAIATNTTVGTEINSLGATVYPSANSAASSFLALPALIPSEVMNSFTVGVIFQAKTFGVGQGLVSSNTSGSFKLQTNNTGVIQYIASGVTVWTMPSPAIAGHNYLVVMSMNRTSVKSNSIVLDMTTGQLTQFNGQLANASPTAGTQYAVLTYNFGSGVNNGRIAAAMISNGTLNPGQLLAWAADPWSLWYDTSPSALIRSAGTHATIIPPPPTGGLLANPFSYVSLATANATSVVSRPTAITGWDMINLSTTTRYVRVYNKATAPVPATDSALIVARFAIPAGQRVADQLGTNAGWLSAGMSFDITAAAPDTDATVTAAGDVIVNLFFT